MNLKEVEKVVWHIVLHDKFNSFKKTLIAYDDEKQAKCEAQKYAELGSLVSLYCSNEVVFKKLYPMEIWVNEYMNCVGQKPNWLGDVLLTEQEAQFNALNVSKSYKFVRTIKFREVMEE